MSVQPAREVTPLPQRDRSPILTAAVDTIVPTMLVFAIFMLFAGHSAPGGGFVGGLVAVAALTLRYIDSGVRGLRAALGVSPFLLLGLGIVCSTATGTIPVLLGNSYLESDIIKFSVPVIGAIKLTSPLFFDIGVFLVVLGSGLMLLETIGASARDIVATPGEPPVEPVAQAAPDSAMGTPGAPGMSAAGGSERVAP